MTTTTADLRLTLRYLIHEGLTEIRALATLHETYEQIAHLADVLEFLPRHLGDDREPNYDVILEQFEGYAQRYPESSGQRYVEFLSGGRTVPDHY